MVTFGFKILFQAVIEINNNLATEVPILYIKIALLLMYDIKKSYSKDLPSNTCLAESLSVYILYLIISNI